MTSCTEQPGKKYLLPPEKPTTSWGKTGPTMRFTSDSTHRRLICTRIGTSSRRPPVSSEICPAGIRSEERRVGKEGRAGSGRGRDKEEITQNQRRKRRTR